MFDLTIIGSGPAALTAAIYAARAGLNTTVYEKRNYGGILAEIPLIENYPGFIGAGSQLAEQMRQQAERTGAKIDYGECLEIKQLEDNLVIKIEGQAVQSKAVLVATGSDPRPLDFSLSIPTSYCALCDGPLARGKNVVVVGGANSAVQEALYLANLAQSVTIITHSQLKADTRLINELNKDARIKVQENLEPTPELLNQFDHAFVYIGKTPATHFLERNLLDQSGYVICDNKLYPHQTKLSGLFAAGDVRAGSIKQVVTAAGDGAAAAIEISQYLHAKKETFELIEQSNI